jgi:hypothetical protein
MTKLYWKCLSVCVSAGLLLIFLNSGCGGGGGSGGGAVGPTAPTIADVAGNWYGSFALESATGCGCIGSAVQLAIGLSFESTMEISQSGAAAQGRWISPGAAEWCDFAGTVGSESLHAEATGCMTVEETDVECMNGNRRDLHWAGATLQATVFGNDMNGTLVETWDCFHSHTGEPKGTLTLNGRIEQERG